MGWEGTNYTSYNAINQVGEVNGVAMTYDANGNLTNDGTNTYVWDRANRLLSVGSSVYAYDGMNNRVQQTVGGTATKYLLDLQPGLTQVLAATTGASTDRYVHALRGIHAMKNNVGDWIWPTQDGLGNVRQEMSDGLAVNGARDYEPFLIPFDEQGSFGMPFGATGEMTDVTGQVYLRNRYLSPSLGQFVSLDPFEGMTNRAMSLNGYLWVEGNVPNDAVGELGCVNNDRYSKAKAIKWAAVDSLELINGYSYANGKPINRVDPSGMFSIPSGIAIAESRDLATVMSSGTCAIDTHFQQQGECEATCVQLLVFGPFSPIVYEICRSYCNSQRRSKLLSQIPPIGSAASVQFDCAFPKSAWAVWKIDPGAYNFQITVYRQQIGGDDQPDIPVFAELPRPGGICEGTAGCCVGLVVGSPNPYEDISVLDIITTNASLFRDGCENNSTATTAMELALDTCKILYEMQ